MNSQQLFWYEGPATNGQRVENLTVTEALELQKQEEEMLRQREQDARMGPRINEQIRAWENSRRRTPLDGLPTEPQGDAVMSSLDNLSKQRSAADIDELEAAAMETAGMREGAMALRQGRPGPLGGLPVGDDTLTPQTQPVGTIEAIAGDKAYLFDKVPASMAKRLIFAYRTGKIKPTELFDQLGKIQDQMEERERKMAEKKYESEIAEKPPALVKNEPKKNFGAGGFKIVGHHGNIIELEDGRKYELPDARALRRVLGFETVQIDWDTEGRGVLTLYNADDGEGAAPGEVDTFTTPVREIKK